MIRQVFDLSLIHNNVEVYTASTLFVYCFQNAIFAERPRNTFSLGREQKFHRHVAKKLSG